MKQETCDVVIVGAGFAGCLLALIGQKVGLKVVLLERGRHPRFRIGESSTPLANLKLEVLAERYDLPWLIPFANYGSWKRTYPDVACGLKRGFSFFSHRPGKAFKPVGDHVNELLVEANPNAERGDTHWFREEFDAFVAEKVVEAKVPYLDRFESTSVVHEDSWRICGRQDGGDEIEITASFAVDASGVGQALLEATGNKVTCEGMRTDTRSLYGHFENVGLWSEVLSGRGHKLKDHPFDPDTSALHHLIEGGWMWVLRFDNGVTSAGFSLDSQHHPLDATIAPEEEWRRLLGQYPSIRRQFVRAKPVQPMVRTGRLQRRLSTSAGDDWAALPHTACFVDPFLSSGNAHTLYGVERLARILEKHWDAPDRSEQLGAYAKTMFREMRRFDRIVSTCIESFDRFGIMTSVSMLYFAAAIYSEERIRAGEHTEDDEFLLAQDARLAKIMAKVCNGSTGMAIGNELAFSKRVHRMIEPYNTAGLCDPEKLNMYPFASPKAPSDPGE